MPNREKNKNNDYTFTLLLERLAWDDNVLEVETVLMALKGLDRVDNSVAAATEGDMIWPCFDVVGDSEEMEHMKQRIVSNHDAEEMEKTRRSKELNNDTEMGELSDQTMITEDDNIIDATKVDLIRPCFDFLGHDENTEKKIESNDDADIGELGRDQMMITEDDNIIDATKGDLIKPWFDFLGPSEKMEKKKKRIESNDDAEKMEEKKKKQKIESNDDAEIGESRSDQPMVTEDNIIAATKGDMICPSFDFFAHGERMEKKKRIESNDDVEKMENKNQRIESNDDAGSMEQRIESNDDVEKIEKKKHMIESNDDVEKIEKKKHRIESNDNAEKMEKKKQRIESSHAAEKGELKSDQTMITDDHWPISLDVMESIFARLPLKSMFQLRVLSKFWSTNIFSLNFRGEVHSYWKKVPPTSETLHGLMHIERDEDAHELFDWLTVKHQTPPPDKRPRPQPAVLCLGS